MKKRLISLMLALVLLTACAQGGGSTGTEASGTEAYGGSTGTETAGTEEFSGSESAEQESVGTVTIQHTALVEGVLDIHTKDLTPKVPQVTIAEDYSNVMYGENISGDILYKNGFQISSLDDLSSYEFYSYYYDLRWKYIPIFVTTDSILHTYHLYYEHLLRTIEKGKLADLVSALSMKMQEESKSQLEVLRGTEWEQAALRNVAYFSVACSLIGANADVPDDATEMVNTELERIRQTESVAASAIMGTDEDYTQYEPRGYYASDKRLTQYFQTMMWYGRILFRSDTEEHVKSAMLMTLALNHEEAKNAWEILYATTAFFAGESDDLTEFEYCQAMKNVFGDLQEASQLVTDSTAVSKFKDELSTMRSPSISPLSGAVSTQETAQGLCFMGQRFTLDADIFTRLTYDRVDKNEAGQVRILPDALDVPAAFGSDKALQILTEQGDTAYPNYSENMQSLREEINNLSDAEWSKNLYNGWLNMIRPLTLKKGEGWPQFMQTDAWQNKDLLTFLSSWTELKHDTLLYTKEPPTGLGGGGELPTEKDDRGYVEPEPALYGRLSSLCAATIEGLEKFGLMAEKEKADMERLAELSRQLMVISEKELLDEARTSEEYQLIRDYGQELDYFWETVTMEKAGVDDPFKVSSFEWPGALVSDIATDVDSQTVLQVATGLVNRIDVIVVIDGEPRLAQGCVYSFHQFTRPMNDRMTDQVWWDVVFPNWWTPGFTTDPDAEELKQQPAWLDGIYTE